MKNLLRRVRKILGYMHSPESSSKSDQLAPDHFRLASFAVEHAPDAIYWILPDATIFYANQSACLSLGLSPEELIGRSVLDINPGLEVSAWDAHWQDIKATHKVTLETEHKHVTGKVFPVEITANYMAFDGGEYNYAIARDITERKENELEKEKSRQQLESLLAERAQTLESALKKSDERLRLAIEASQAGIWDWNIQTGETYCSPAYFEMLGYESSQFDPNVESLFTNLLHPDERDNILQFILQELNGPGFYTVDFQIQAKDGTYRWIRSRGKLVQHDGQGSLLRAIGTHTDITNWKLAELALIESEHRFRDMADSAPVMIWMSGLDMLCYFFNQTWLDFTGRTEEQESGNGWAERVHPDDLERCMKIYTESFNAQQPFRMDYRLLRHDNEYRWIEDNGRPRYDGEGRFLGYIGSCIDVTERKETEEYFKVIVEASPNAMLLLNDRGIIELVNHEFERLFGYRAEDIIGQRIESIVPDEVAHDHVKYRDAYIQKPVSCEIGKERIVRGKRRDGTTFQVEIGLSPVRVRSRQFVISVIVDVTERKKAEQAILDMNANLEEKVLDRTKALERASAAKSEFLANMSHEIRNPMNTINLSAHLLSRESLSDTQLNMVHRIIRSSKSLLTIVNEILDFSKMEAGQVDLELAPMNLNDLIERVAESQAVMAADKGIRLHAQIFLKDLPDVMGDAVRIEQILNNLLSNAIKFTSEGDVWLRVVLNRKDQDTVSVAFEVADTGDGIPDEIIPSLGQPFTQADSSITRKFGGTGLGLSICKKILGLMSSTLVIHSTVGLGSSFSFELTLNLAGVTLRDSTMTGSVPLLAGFHILIVDDDEANLAGMRGVLIGQGAEVTVTVDGESAIGLVDQNQENFSLILMDIQMPVMDGIQTTKHIRNRLKQDQLPIIAVTAGIRPDQHQEAMAAGINQLVRKPVDPEALIKTILTVLA